MATQTQQEPQKKKIPGWLKVVIVLAILVVGFSVVASVGISFLAGLLTSKSGEQLAQKGIEKMIEKGIEQSGGGKAKVDITHDGIVIKDQKGGEQIAIQGGKQMPAGFPSDIPVYQPSEAQGSMVMGPMTMVTLETPSALGDVSSFYQNQLAQQGWTAAFATSPTSQSYSGLFKKDKRQVTVNLAAESGKTSIVLTYGLEQVQ